MFVGFVFWFLLCLSFNVESYEHSVRPGRIIGGKPANITDFPYQVAIERRLFGSYYYFVCGASIIQRSWALTAAHCVYGPRKSQIRLRSGSSYKMRGGTLHDVEKIIIHPEYEGIFDYDVAIIKVSTKFHYSEVTQKISMAHKTPSPGSEAVVSGWGSVNVEMESPDQLQQLTVNIVGYEECETLSLFLFFVLTPRMLCANVPEGGKSIFLGDSGGPLVVDGILVGIVSFLQKYNFLSLPSAYIDVANIRTWVTENIQLESVNH